MQLLMGNIEVHPPWRQSLSLKLTAAVCEQTRYLMCLDSIQEEQYYNKNDTSSLL